MCGLKSSLLPAFGQPRGLQGFPEPEMVKLKCEGRMSGEGRAGKSPGEGAAPAKPVSRRNLASSSHASVDQLLPQTVREQCGEADRETSQAGRACSFPRLWAPISLRKA